MKHVLNSKEAKVIFLLCIAQMFKYCLIYDNMSKGSGSPGIAGFFYYFVYYHKYFQNALLLFRIDDGYFWKIL